MKRYFGFTLRILLSVLTVCAFATVISAQEVTGSINGTVKDASGGAVPGAIVTFSDADKKVVLRTATTNADG